MTVRRNFSSGTVTTTSVDKTYSFGFTPQVGSALAVFIHANATATTPSGWIKTSEVVGSYASYLFTRTSDGTETSVSWTQNGDRPAVVMVWEYDTPIITSPFFEPVDNGVPASASVVGSGVVVFARFGNVASATPPNVSWSGATELADEFVYSGTENNGDWASCAETPYFVSGEVSIIVNGMPSAGGRDAFTFTSAPAGQSEALAQYSGAASTTHSVSFERSSSAGTDLLLFGISDSVPSIPVGWVADRLATPNDCSFIFRLPGASNSGINAVTLTLAISRALAAVVVETGVSGAPVYSNFSTASGNIVSSGTLIGTGLHTFASGNSEFAVFWRSKYATNSISGAFSSMDQGYVIAGQAKVEPTATFPGHFLAIGRKFNGAGMANNGVTASLSPPITTSGLYSAASIPGMIVYSSRVIEPPAPVIGDPYPLMLSDGEQWHSLAVPDHTHPIGDLPAGLATDAEVTAAITAHEAAADPHPVYLTQTEGDARYTALTVDPDPPTAPGTGALWLDPDTGAVNEYSGAGTVSLWNGAAITGGGTGTEGDSITLATRFYSTVDGTVSGIAVFAPGDTALEVGLYSVGSPGTLLSSQSYSPTTRSAAWYTFAIPPVPIAASTRYIACVWRPFGASYYRTLNYFLSATASGPLIAPTSTGPEPNGIYAIGGGSLSYPTSTYQNASYFVDPQFTVGDPWMELVKLALSSELGGHTIQDEGTSLSTRSKLNFEGDGVFASDDLANDATVVTINSNPVQATWSMGPAVTASTGGYKWRAKRPYTITSVSADLGTAPGVGESFNVDLTRNGIAMLSAPMIFSSGNLTKNGTLSLTSLATDDYLEVMVSSVIGATAQRLTVNVELV